MNVRTLKIVHVFPPVPTRDFDWMVYDDNEAEKPRCVGFGATEWDAIHEYADDLKEFTLSEQDPPVVPVSEDKKLAPPDGDI